MIILLSFFEFINFFFLSDCFLKRLTKFSIFANAIEEKKTRIPEFLVGKTKRISGIGRNARHFISPFELAEIENKVNDDNLKGLPEELLPFSLLIQIKSIMVRFCC